jgi:hypothetical protein
MPSGSTVTLVSFIVISIYIRLFKLRANQYHTLDLPSLVVGLQASCNKKGSLFESISSLLYTYKSNSCCEVQFYALAYALVSHGQRTKECMLIELSAHLGVLDYYYIYIQGK